MIAQSATRVPDNTAPAVQRQIDHQTELNVRWFASHPEQIERRLKELDREWDIERALETGAASLTLFSLTQYLLGKRRWLLVAGAVPGFLLQHALQGWCPPLVVFRKLGFRTRDEINMERYALKAARGDFDAIPENRDNADELLLATQV